MRTGSSAANMFSGSVSTFSDCKNGKASGARVGAATSPIMSKLKTAASVSETPGFRIAFKVRGFTAFPLCLQLFSLPIIHR